MTASQPNLLELAKQGDARAIATLMNRQLQPKGITAKVALKDGCLQVMLEANQVPDQQALTTFVRKSIITLDIPEFKQLKIYGRQVGDEFPAWSHEFKLSSHLSSTETRIEAPQQDFRHTTLVKGQKVEIKSEDRSLSYQVLGVNGQIRLTHNRVIISRKGILGFLAQGLAGDKEIPISRITAIQFKHPDEITSGYIQFSIQGGLEARGGVFSATKDENTVMFSSSQKLEFEEIKRYVDSIMDGESIDFLNLHLSTKPVEQQLEEEAKRKRIQADRKAKRDRELENIFWQKSKKYLIAIIVISSILLLIAPDGSGFKIMAVFAWIGSIVLFLFSLTKF